MLIFFFANDAVADSTGAALASKLAASLPKSWVVTERRLGVLPEGHYWGQKYVGDRGEEILLQGVADVHVSWQDASGEWRSEVVGKEALKLYVMPSAYRDPAAPSDRTSACGDSVGQDLRSPIVQGH
jgi:hypothetical protein